MILFCYFGYGLYCNHTTFAAQYILWLCDILKMSRFGTRSRAKGSLPELHT